VVQYAERGSATTRKGEHDPKICVLGAQVTDDYKIMTMLMHQQRETTFEKLNGLQVSKARNAVAAPERQLMRMSLVSIVNELWVSSIDVRILENDHIRVPAINQSVKTVSTAHALTKTAKFST